MLPIKSLKIHVDNHSKIPIPNPQKKKKKQPKYLSKNTCNSIKHTHTHTQ